MLQNKYYKVLKETKLNVNEAVYLISLYPQADVYRGHFPQKPVCPGVCNIQTIRECAEMLVGRKLNLKTVNRCRLTAVATPQVCPILDVAVSLLPNDDKTGYTVMAKMYSDVETFMELKAELEVKA